MKLFGDKIDQFKERYPYANVKFDEELLCSMRTGGMVDILVTPESELEIITAIRLCNEISLPYHVAGNLSNTLIKDGGFRGAVIQIGKGYSGYAVQKDTISVKSGTSLIKFAKDMTDMGYGGLEFAGGIPGTVGGGIFMNAGAYEGQMSDVVSAVKVFDGTHIVILPKEQLSFSYRNSIFMKKREWIILEGQFRLRKGEGDKEALTTYNRWRAEKQPLDKPNCGSVFKRPQDGFAARLIDDAGLRGETVGDAQVSEKHSGFIVNNGQASSKDVLTLMKRVQDQVLSKKNVVLLPEWVIIGED